MPSRPDRPSKPEITVCSASRIFIMYNKKRASRLLPTSQPVNNVGNPPLDDIFRKLPVAKGMLFTSRYHYPSPPPPSTVLLT